MKEEKILDQEETDIVEKQIMSPISDTEDGNLEIVDKELGEEEDVDVIIELLNKDVKDSFSPKYQEELANMAKEDPTSVMIETPEGWMTIAEAMKGGFNPESGEFDGETLEERIDKIIAEEGLDPDEAARIKQMILQQEGGEAPMEEEMPEGLPMGEEEMMPEGMLPPEEEVPEEGMPMEEEGMPMGGGPAIDPAMLAALGGGM